MTTDIFNKKLQAKIDAIEKNNIPLLLAVKSIMSVQSKRIFIDGKNADGGEIGDYVDKPVYISLSESPKKFTPRGKPSGKTRTKKTYSFAGSSGESIQVKKETVSVKGKVKKSDGSSRKSGWFPNYLTFKTTIGRNKNIKTVDLFLSGQLSQDWANATVLAKANARRVNQNRYIVTLKEKNLAKTSRYGNVFGISKSEKDSFLKVIKFELIKALQ